MEYDPGRRTLQSGVVALDPAMAASIVALVDRDMLVNSPNDKGQAPARSRQRHKRRYDKDEVLDPNPLLWGLNIIDKDHRRHLFRFSRNYSSNGTLTDISLDLVPTFEEGRVKLKKSPKSRQSSGVVSDTSAPPESAQPPRKSKQERAAEPPANRPPHPITGSTPASMRGFRPKKFDDQDAPKPKGGGKLPKNMPLTRDANARRCEEQRTSFFKDYYSCDTPPSKHDHDSAQSSDAGLEENIVVWARARKIPIAGVESIEGIMSLPSNFYRRKAGFPKALRIRDDHRKSHKLEVRILSKSNGIRPDC